MDCYNLILIASMALGASAWSMPFYPVHRAPLPVTRFARTQRHIILPVRKEPSWQPEQPQWERPKRERDDYDHDYDHDHDHKRTSGVTGPVHTFVKTDKNANYKWGVRHHILIASMALGASAWSMPFYPVHRAPLPVTRFARPQRHIILPVRKEPSWQPEQPQWERPKRERDDYDHDYDHDHDHKRTSGVTGPVHTFVKTDKNANYKWGVRHHVGNKYAS